MGVAYVVHCIGLKPQSRQKIELSGNLAGRIAPFQEQVVSGCGVLLQRRSVRSDFAHGCQSLSYSCYLESPL